MSENHPLDDAKLAEIRSNFEFFDRDNNQQIDADEFAMLLQVLSPDTPRERALDGFQLVDTNHDGHIDFDEFISWWKTCWWEY